MCNPVQADFGAEACCSCSLPLLFTEPLAAAGEQQCGREGLNYYVLFFFLVSTATILQESGAPMGRQALIESVMRVKIEISVDG